MQQRRYEQFKFLGHAVDHFSKFRVIFALKTKEATEVAQNLDEKVFSVFGLPSILHSDNGKEFVNFVIKATIAIWPGVCNIVNGGVRHSQSQGVVEQENHTIEKMISAKSLESNSNNWSKWLPH